MKKSIEISIIIFVLLMPILHEFGHFLGYAIDGVSATISYGFVTVDKLTISGVIGGPMFNILLSIISLTLIYIDSKRKNFWGIIGLVSVISRVLCSGIIFLIGILFNPVVLPNNDEGQLAVLMGNSIQFQYIFFILIYIILTILIIKSIQDSKVAKKLSIRIIGYNIMLISYLTLT